MKMNLNLKVWRTRRAMCNGGAIEYDLLEEIARDIQKKFNISKDEYYDKYSGIINDYMMDTIEWYDRLVFNKSDQAYQSMSDRFLGKKIDTSHWDSTTIDGKEIKL